MYETGGSWAEIPLVCVDMVSSVVTPRDTLNTTEAEEQEFLTFMEPRNRFQGVNSASLCGLAGRYDNPIPTRLQPPIECLKIPAHGVASTEWQLPLSGVHFITRAAWWGVGVGGAGPPSFTISTITYKVAVYAPFERTDTLPLSLLNHYMYSVVSTNDNLHCTVTSHPRTP